MEKKVAWWDKLGKPQYGGTMVLRFPANIVNFDPILRIIAYPDILGMDGKPGCGRLDIGPVSIRL